jgi:hypothetical protein
VNKGIELRDIGPAAASNPQLTFEEKLDLITVEPVWKELDNLLQKLL